MRVKLFFKWYDLWVGFYYDKQDEALYFCPFPTIGIKFGGKPDVYYKIR
ncbi:MAG: hypothetical protein NTX24_02490 [Candidatus Pacearchaeota archaeon]|nr:hypothetical protein [Candidatus Pacearchaeota archaeon]